MPGKTLDTTVYSYDDNAEVEDMETLTADDIEEDILNDELQFEHPFSAIQSGEDSISETERNRRRLLSRRLRMAIEIESPSIGLEVPNEQVPLECMSKILHELQNIHNDIKQIREEMDEMKVKLESCSQDISLMKNRNMFIYGSKIGPKS